MAMSDLRNDPRFADDVVPHVDTLPSMSRVMCYFNVAPEIVGVRNDKESENRI